MSSSTELLRHGSITFQGGGNRPASLQGIVGFALTLNKTRPLSPFPVLFQFCNRFVMLPVGPMKILYFQHTAFISVVSAQIFGR